MFALIIYLLVSIFLQLKFNNIKTDIGQIRLISNSDFSNSLAESIRSDTNTKTILITRAFHNKLWSTGEEFSLNIARALDPSYLFGFNQSGMYEESNKYVLLYPFEFPIFLIFLFYLVNNKIKYKKILLILITFSLITIGLLEPHYSFIKFFPLIFTLKIGIFLGFVELLSGLKWLKK